MFEIDENRELTLSDFNYFKDKFITSKLSELNKLNRYYKNENEINIREFSDESKPNNKLSHSFANYITITNTTMFLGSPISYKSEDDLKDYNNVLDIADEQDININLSTNASKYGYAIQLLYLNEDANIKMAALDNRQTVLIYSDSIESKLLYCIRYWRRETIDNSFNDFMTVYSKFSTKTYKDNILTSDEVNHFSDIPIIVYKNNEDMTGDYKNVISLIDAYDLLESDSVNENDYFNNAYLYLNTDGLDPKIIKEMKENRVIGGEDLNPSFVLKNSQNADGDIEKTRIVSDIHKLSFTPDMSDNNFANNVSGVAMQYKLLGPLNNIANKQRKFKKAIDDRNKLIFSMMRTKMLKVPEKVACVFTINLPKNMLETAQTINLLRGLVSDETLMSQLTFVEDAQAELKKTKATMAINTFGEDVETEGEELDE